LSEQSPPQLAGFLAGSLLAGYRLEAQVGAGGMAVVFRARDERLDRLVALKILAPGLADDSEFRQRFIAESRAAAAVDDPHIIPVYEAGEADGALFIAMRFVQGGDLRQVLEREGALAPDRAAGFISPVASALDAAHRAGLVHRDVKPANVLVDAREDRPDHVYLSDFGVSKRAMSQAGLTAVGMFLGTPDYSAPEQIEGQPVDGRTDQYALACVSYQLLTGTVPFERDQGMAVLLAHLSKPPPSAVARRPELPGAVDQVLAKGMAKVPDERYESCSDFADALREALGLAPYRRRGSSDRRSAPVDSPPSGGSVGVAEVLTPIVVTGPGSPGREADDDTGSAGSRWRRLHRPAARKRRTPSSTAAVAPEDMPAAAAAASPESPPAGGLGTAARPDEPAAPQTPVASPPEIPSVAAAAALTPADVGGAVESDLEAATAEARPGEPAAPQTPVASPPEIPSPAADATVATFALDDAAAVMPGPAFSATIDPAPGVGSAGTADPPTPLPVTGPGRVGRETDGGVGTAWWTVGRDAMTDPRSGTDAVAPDRYPQPGVGERPGTITDWIRRYRPLVFALACAILASAVALPFVLASPAHSPSRATPPSPGNSPRPVSSPIDNRVAINLPAGYQGLVSSLAFSPSGATLAIAAYGVCLWNMAATGCIPGPRLTTAYSVAFSPDGTILACGDDTNGSTYLWNVGTAKRLLVATLPDPASEGVDSVAFSPDGKILAAGDANGSTYLWNVATEKMIGTLADSPSKGVESVAFSPDGKTLAAGDANGRTYLWNVAGKNRTTTLADSDGKAVDSVAFSPDGKTLAAGDANGSTYLWNVAGGNATATLADSGSKGVESVAFSPDGKTLAAGDANGSTYLWNVATTKPITTLADPGSTGVNSVAFSANGRTLATADQNDSGSVYLWHIS
jgi:serine/threonine protein kinase/Tol biopolymer transport system component